ncbi:MAG: hypothetical protein IPL97_03110 [Niastella sp.]|nr:hypothetical protein [Niastella sp.]
MRCDIVILGTNIPFAVLFTSNIALASATEASLLMDTDWEKIADDVLKDISNKNTIFFMGIYFFSDFLIQLINTLYIQNCAL